MKACLIISGENQDMKTLGKRFPTTLLPFPDRPFLQQVIEYLVNQGIVEFDVFLSQAPELIEAFLVDGSRWGVKFRYHLLKDATKPLRQIKAVIGDDEDQRILLVNTTSLILVDLYENVPEGAILSPILYCRKEMPTGDCDLYTLWTGWGWISAAHLHMLPDDTSWHDVYNALSSQNGSRVTTVDDQYMLSVSDLKNFQLSLRAVLSGDIQGLMTKGREIEKGVWLSRNVSLHPTVTVNPPVYIGENTRIEKGVTLGPFAVVGSNSLLDSGSTIIDSVICPGSYVGKSLELKDTIVDKNLLVNIRHGAEITVAETFIIGSMRDTPIRRKLHDILSRLSGAALFIVFFPLFLSTALYLAISGKRPLLNRKKVVRIPAMSDPAAWASFMLFSFVKSEAVSPENGHLGRVLSARQSFFLVFLPALINVMRGDICLIGVIPRSQEEVLSLQDDWRELYLSNKAGIVTEAFLNFGIKITRDDLYSAEAFYTVSSGFMYDLKLFIRYFLQIFGPARNTE